MTMNKKLYLCMSEFFRSVVPKKSPHARGFTLIEVTVFIVILGIAAAGILLSFQTALHATPEDLRATMALDLTQGRLNIITGQHSIVGFNDFNDICTTSPSLALCQLPSGYRINTSIVPSGSIKTITVTTQYNGVTEAKLSTIVAEF